MATKNSASTKRKFDQLKREDDLVDAMCYALTSQVAEHAVAWSRRARRLSEGLSATAIRRARKRARKISEDMPPGYVKAREAMDAHDAICRKYRIPKRDQDLLWGAVVQVCMYQLTSRRGMFFEAARDFGLAPVDEPTAPRVDRAFAARDGNAVCDCPNCRPRKAEELN